MPRMTGKVKNMHAYCLFCETQRCKDIAKIIEKISDCRCIFPRVIQRKWVKGVAREVTHACLPGYLFLFTEEDIYPYFSVSGILRVLGRGELEGADLNFANMIYKCDGLLGTVRLAQVGDRCHISDPLWENLQGTIVKVDRGRKRCCVEFTFDRQKRRIWVGYDLIKTEEEHNSSL